MLCCGGGVTACLIAAMAMCRLDRGVPLVKVLDDRVGEKESVSLRNPTGRARGHTRARSRRLLLSMCSGSAGGSTAKSLSCHRCWRERWSSTALCCRPPSRPARSSIFESVLLDPALPGPVCCLLVTACWRRIRGVCASLSLESTRLSLSAE